MTTFKCENILTKDGWKSDLYVSIGSDGIITNLSQTSDQPATPLTGYIIPGFQNAHSHSFQYAMAGLAEHLPSDAKTDDFWSWREAMYNLALKITPEEFEAVASMLYCEMLKQGITHVVEFHYVHNNQNGQRYERLAEMSQRLVAAAARTGIELTLVPIFYHHGGFGKPAVPKQRRFLSDSVASYLELHAAVKETCHGATDARCGLGVHSLRAGSEEQIAAIIAQTKEGPFHIHISEQEQEINDCVSYYGKRPVEWMLDTFAIDARFSFTHATHMTEDETQRLAASKATAIICPSTEANLGDGFFNLLSYRNHGGHYTIGTDSHIGLSAIEELRWLDYVQRLRIQKRNVICRHPNEDSATTMVLETWRGGRRARGELTDEAFAVGAPFDCVIIDKDHPVMIGKPSPRALGAFIYGGDFSAIKQVMRRGRAVVKDGKHVQANGISNDYRAAMQLLTSRS